jgi:hypothetical protein
MGELTPIKDRILMDVDDVLAGMTPREGFRWIEELIAELDVRLDKVRLEFHRGQIKTPPSQ